MTDRDTLLANCLDQPTDDTARLVYADWLRDHDSPLGEFVWAGVTLSRFRGHDPVTDGMFFDAQRQLNDVAPGAIGGQLQALFGWQWGDVLWDQGDQEPDRLTAVHIPLAHSNRAEHSRRVRGRPRVKAMFPAAVYERGMLCGLRVSLARWREVAAQVLAVCPLERVEILDVPGLTFTVDQTASGWRLAVELKLPVRRQFTFTTATARRIAHQTYVFDRPKLLTLIERAIDDLTAYCRSEAGERWPGPTEQAQPLDVPALNALIAQINSGEEPPEEEYGGPMDSEDM